MEQAKQFVGCQLSDDERVGAAEKSAIRKYEINVWVEKQNHKYEEPDAVLSDSVCLVIVDML